VALALALRDADVGAIRSALARAGVLTLLAGTAAHLVVQLLYAARWRLLLDRPPGLGMQRSYGLVGLGYLANYTLPGRPGELVRGALASALGGVPLAAALASLFLEKVLDGATILGSAALLALSGPLPETLNTSARLGALVLGVGALVLAAIAFLRPTRLPRLLAEVGAPVRGLASWRVASGVTVLGLGCASAIVLHQGLLCLGVGLAIPIGGWLLLYAALGLASIVPGAPGYVGTYQLAAIYALGAYGVDRESAFAVATLYQASRLLGSLIVGTWAGGREGLGALRGAAGSHYTRRP
jgi:uncharacterized membrane protein YbhN (UPF0104 family)